MLLTVLSYTKYLKKKFKKSNRTLGPDNLIINT